MNVHAYVSAACCILATLRCTQQYHRKEMLPTYYGTTHHVLIQAFSMYQCVTYEEMPESDEWYQRLGDVDKEKLGFESYSYLLADVQQYCVQDATGKGIEPADPEIKQLGIVVLALFCGAVPLLYLVLLMLARKPITDSMFEATKLSTALSFLYQVATLTLAP